MAGSYIEPLYQIKGSFGSGGNDMGHVTFEGSDRRIEYQYRCPSTVSQRTTALWKSMNYACPVGYEPVHYLPGENSINAWFGGKQCAPNISEVSGNSIKVTEVVGRSCPANANPCYPATGDKERIETDFTFAGRPFQRVYHSTRQFPLSSDPGFGVSWRHSYSQVVDKFESHSFKFVDENGYSESFKFAASGAEIYSSANTGRKMRRTAWSTSKAVQILELDGDVRKFNSQGLLESITNPSRPEKDIFLYYDLDKRLISAVDYSGREVFFLYDEEKISSILLPDLRQILYHYDGSGHLVKVESAGISREYHYEEAGLGFPNTHQLTGITDETGSRYATFTYDVYGRVTSSRLHAEGGDADLTLLEYLSDSQVKVTNASGAVTIYEVDDGLHRRITSVTGLGGETVFSHNSNESLLQHISPSGGITKYGYKYQSASYVSSVIEAYGEAESRVHELLRNGDNQLMRYNLRGKAGGSWRNEMRVSRAYDGQGRMKATCAHDVNSTSALNYSCGSASSPPLGVEQVLVGRCDAVDVATQGTRCPILGLLKYVDGPRGDVPDITNFEYYGSQDLTGCDTAGACHHAGDLWRVTGPTGRVIEYARYNRAGRPTRIIDQNGVATDLEYHPRGWVTSLKVRGADDLSEVDDAVTRVEYDGVGQVIRVTRPDGSWIIFDYDNAHRLVGIRDALGNKMTFVLDGAGNRVREELRGSDDALRSSLSWVYDQLGQLETLADGQATPTDFSYDLGRNVDTITDPYGRVARLDHDSFGRLKQLISNDTGIGNERAVTEFTYDALDRPTAITDPKGLTTRYEYDGLGNLVELDSPDTGTTSFAYDEAGNVLSKLDSRGIETRYAYDAGGRLLMVDVPAADEDVTLVYDVASAVCQLGETFVIGSLTRMADYSGITDYCYDYRGNVVRKAQTLAGGPTRTIGYGYDLADRLTELTYPSGAKVVYQRDATGRISGVQLMNTPGTPVETLVSAAVYEPFGPLIQLTFGNGRVLSKTYDQNYAITSVVDSAQDGISVEFTLDAVGNVTGIQERLVNGLVADRTVDYDDLNRLIALKQGVSPLESFAYDSTGNRLSKAKSSVTDYTYAGNSHLLTQVGSQGRSYDAAGNSVTIGGKYFSYDDYGRMRQLIDGGAMRTEYRFNGKGERVSKVDHISPNDSRTFLYDEVGRLLGEYQPDGSVQNEYIWMDDTLIAVLGGYQDHAFQYVLTDHLGTPRAVVNPPSDSIIWRWDLTGSAFGEHGVEADPDGDAATYTLHLRYPGQYYDDESGLHYNYFRDYDPSSGRYLQSDPIGLSGGLSTFSYVGSNPLSGIDPLGLFDLTATFFSNSSGSGFSYQMRFFTESCKVEQARLAAEKIGPKLASRLAQVWAPLRVVGGAGKASEMLPEPVPVGSSELKGRDFCECISVDAQLKNALEEALGRPYSDGDPLSQSELDKGLQAMQERYWKIAPSIGERNSAARQRYRRFYDWDQVQSQAQSRAVRSACQIAGTC